MGDSIGAHLRRRRKNLGLLQIEAAAQMGVGQYTLIRWEKGYAQPEVRFYPTIINFLGYEPWPEPRALGEKLKARRRHLGLSVKACAQIVGVDEATFGRWEAGAKQAYARFDGKISTFLRPI